MPTKEPVVAAKTQRRRKAPTLREHDWEPLKTRIVELHVKRNMSLPDVRALMQRERGFEATLRQYRSRISHWGLDKNIKTKEMNFIARKYYQRREGSGSRSMYTFRVRGKIVPPAKIHRWAERSSTRPITGENDANASDETIRDRLASLVRYRQPSVKDSPVNSLRDLYRQQDLSSLLGSLEIDDVLVGPYVADAQNDDTNGLDSAGVASDLHTSVTGALIDFELAQKAEEHRSSRELTPLVHLFFEHAHHFVPVLDKQDFLQRWDLDRESIPMPTRSAVFSLAEALNDAPENALKWFCLARGQLSPSLHSPNLATLQALLILLKVKESMKKENYYYDSWLGVSRCIQIAHSLQLSRHTSHQAPGVCDSGAAKCRLMRRVWQTIYVVEVMISYPNAYSALTVPVGTVDFSLGLNEDGFHSATKEEFQFTQLALLAALTSSDARLNSGAADYLNRQMRLLESCQELWPSPELTSQVNKLRELLSEGAPRAFWLSEPLNNDSETVTYTQGLVSDWLGPEDIDGNDVNSWIDAFL
ncbi:C6 finger domain protein, putative [Cordyceps militaris CM01]|uniref:C6 finger domain protein, putative n=1 Tax=Cordyceps militaris (strain CM01) TaxID=983644 RepID=G3JP11_CORMM|nr:C6 finger domain protein, putative [Cordyceps militaris CM01]EGX89621.1 C6 finger domain protein, putative [Cordyceps militaris CM01]